jgi:hypothetical protein
MGAGGELLESSKLSVGYEMRKGLVLKALCVLAMVLPFHAASLNAQTIAPSLVLKFGGSQSAVESAYGKPFGKMRVNATDENGQVGVQPGLWNVYHLTAPGDRMYVTMVHFGPRKDPLTKESSPSVVDSLMLMPVENWKVAQILNDQPSFAALCAAGCDVIRVSDKAGKLSLLLEPQRAMPKDSVIYFEGDSAIINKKWITSLDSIVAWVWVLPAAAFDSHHTDVSRAVIGTWRPEAKTGK